MRYALKGTLAALFIACNALPAHAQGVVTLVCSRTHDGPPQYQIEINFDRSTVNYPNPNTAAQISNNQIVWHRPRYESGRGEVMVEGRYMLNRTTGVLNMENRCLPKDSSWCNPGGSTDYCRRATRQF